MDPEKKRFAWGVGLAWVPVLLVFGPSLFWVFMAFKVAGPETATGLGVVAAAFGEAMASFGLVAFAVCQVAAIVLLARGIRREAWGRSMVAVVSMACCVGTLGLAGLAGWWWWHVGK